MNPERRKLLVSLLSDIKQLLAEAHSLVTESSDDEVIQRRAKAQLRELQLSLERVEQLLGIK